MDKLQALMDAAQDLAVADYRDGQNADLVIAVVNARNRLIESLASGEVVVITWRELRMECKYRQKWSSGGTVIQYCTYHEDGFGRDVCDDCTNCPRLPR